MLLLFCFPEFRALAALCSTLLGAICLCVGAKKSVGITGCFFIVCLALFLSRYYIQILARPIELNTTQTLKGKTIVMYGATGRLGRAAAIRICALEPKLLILVLRGADERGATLATTIKSAAEEDILANGLGKRVSLKNTRVLTVDSDFCDFSSVVSGAKKIRSIPGINNGIDHILLCNGVYDSAIISRNGYNTIMQINALSNYLFIEQLKTDGLIKAGSRVVMASSSLPFWPLASVSLNMIDFYQGNRFDCGADSETTAYATSKALLLVFMQHWNRTEKFSTVCFAPNPLHNPAILEMYPGNSLLFGSNSLTPYDATHDVLAAMTFQGNGDRLFVNSEALQVRPFPIEDDAMAFMRSISATTSFDFSRATTTSADYASDDDDV